jgi:DNA-binding response OmpR family regulator
MILVVDDDPGIVELLRTALADEGYRVETAHDGAEAYTRVKSPDCKCMLLDVHMPHLNGIELLLLMQAESIHVPTILMAGFKDFDEKEMKQFENVVRFVPKPFKLDHVLRVIRAHAHPPATRRHA